MILNLGCCLNAFVSAENTDELCLPTNVVDFEMKPQKTQWAKSTKPLFYV